MTSSVRCAQCGASITVSGRQEPLVSCSECGHSLDRESVEQETSLPAETNGDVTSDVTEPRGVMELAPQVVDIGWQARPGIVLDHVQTYECGIGAEYVYCYSFPLYLEMAALKGEERYRVKVGSAKGNPVDRIYAQFAGSKTAMAESVVVLLIFRTLAAGHLERWLHKRLEQASDAIGSEWFTTNPAELIALFGAYLRTALDPSIELAKATAPRSAIRYSSVPVISAIDGSSKTRNDQGRRIQAAMNEGLLTPEEIAARTGYSPNRVRNHVNYEVSKRDAGNKS